MSLFKDTNLSVIKDDSLTLEEKAYATGARTAQSYSYLNPSSREPFLTTPLPGIYDDSISTAGILGGNTDFVLRAGTLRKSLDDVSRLTKFFTTSKGALFVAKQNLLSQSGVKTEASGIINDGIYSPTSTLAQVGANGIGGHLLKQGLNPSRDTQSNNNTIFGLDVTNPLALDVYSSVQNQIKTQEGNRLVKFYKGKIVTSNTDDTLYSYSGGPGSDLGVGETQIKMSPEQRTYDKALTPNPTTLTQKQIDSKDRNTTSKIFKDFRSEVENKDKSIIGASYDYENQNIETRVGLGDPGKKGDISDYQKGKTGLIDNIKSSPADKITALPLYQSGLTATTNDVKNDLVKFRIAAVDSEDPSKSVYMHFRAFLGGFSDSYSSAWESQKYMGRAENFHRYSGFDRSISMTWTVPAQSKNELMRMYQKLNYLASNLAPDYVGGRYMGGPLVRLTVGGYLYEQYGFIENLTFTVPDTSPWEIAIPSDKGGESIEGSETQKHDSSVKEMPHMIEVSSFTFRPIHDFVVQKQKNTYGGKEIENANTLTKYGDERYISLESSGDSGYNYQNTRPEKLTEAGTKFFENVTSNIKIGR